MRSKLALTASFVLVSACAFGVVVVSNGCSSSSGGDNPSTDDTGTADSAVDTLPPPADTHKDTRPGVDSADIGAFTCAAPLPASFACKAPTITAKAGTQCSEADLEDFVTACIAKNYTVGTGCAAWKTAHPDCFTCVSGFALTPGGSITDRVYPDRDQCYYTKFTSDCATSWSCMFACDDAVCGSCNKAAGSGADGVSSEFQDCVTAERAHGGTLKPKGACYDVATQKALACDDALPADVTTFCVVNELFTPTGTGGAPDLTKMQQEILEYYRGACRDDGDWSHAADACSTPPCETGSETGAETGTETGTDAGTDGDALLPDVDLDADVLGDAIVDVPAE